MSKCEKLMKKKQKSFKRLIDVNEETFDEIIDVFKVYEIKCKINHGIDGKKLMFLILKYF